MRSKIRSFTAIASAIVIAAIAMLSINAQTAAKKPVPPQNPLVKVLPASDSVVAFNAKRFLNDALPLILGADTPKMAQINAQINAVKEKTGLDLREFEHAAAGIKYKQVSPTEIDFEPVIIASGQFNAAAKIAVVKLAVAGKFREEKAGDKTFFVLPLNDIFADLKKTAGSSSVNKLMDQILRAFSGEIAVGALDEKTLVIGSANRVRETFTATAPVDAELMAAANTKPGAIVNFGGRVPAGLSKLIGLDNEQITEMIDSVRNASGYFDINGTNGQLLIAAKTTTVPEATDIENTMTGLKELGKVLISTVKGEEREVYSRMVDNLRISRVGTKVKFDLLVAQTDLAILGKKL